MATREDATGANPPPPLLLTLSPSFSRSLSLCFVHALCSFAVCWSAGQDTKLETLPLFSRKSRRKKMKNGLSSLVGGVRDRFSDGLFINDEDAHGHDVRVDSNACRDLDA